MRNNYINIFLEQPRRGKTREAQLTPHKAIAVVWGVAHLRNAVWGAVPIILFLALIATSCRDRIDPPTPYNLQIPKGFPTVLNIPADNPMTVEGVELGRLLFHDPHLCGYTGTEPDSLMSCSTCHRQE